MLANILKLYHCDLSKLYEQFQGTQNSRKNFSEKLYMIFETFLPILQYNGNLLQNVYKLNLPYSANNLYLNGIQILEYCQSNDGVLGGLILYNNKVLASQLSVDLTKTLVTTDPVRIKTTGEQINVNFHVPIGCSLIKVYISISEYTHLSRQMKRSAEAISLNPQNVLPFQIKKKSKEQSSMKRDKSLIFTKIHEEEPLIMENPSPIENPKRYNRPNHLPLKFKTIQTRDLPESGIASINFDETDSFPDFIGKTSVCSTPMTENKLLAGPILSIFASKDEDLKLKEEKPKEPKKLEKVFINYAMNPFKTIQRKNSWNELNNIRELEENEEILDTCDSFNVYNTITDPLYPIFNQKRQPLSKLLFEEYHNIYFKTEKPIIPSQITSILKPSRFEVKKIDEIPEASLPSKYDLSIMSKMKIGKKKMLKLPLKSLSLDQDPEKPSTSAAYVPSSIFDSPSTRTKKYMGGLQLTPLMTKLTALAMSENDNFSNYDPPTPTSSYYSADTPIDNNPNKMFLNRLNKAKEEKPEINLGSESEIKRVTLFVCGQQNMTLMLLLDEKSTNNQQLIQKMFDLCVSHLNKLETKLNDIINVDNLENKTNSDYSFINFDKKWDLLKRGGGWQINDLQSLLLIHNDFNENPRLSDIILR